MQVTAFLSALQPITAPLSVHRQATLVGLLRGLIFARSVSLAVLGNYLPGCGQADSNTKRVKRFLKAGLLSKQAILTFVLHWVDTACNGIHLVIDRTDWKGRRGNHINVFMVAVRYKKGCLPLYWKVFSKAGSSNETQRIEVMQELLRCLGERSISSLTADREFIGERWLNYLIDKQIPFHIRIKSNAVVWHKGQCYNLKQLFAHTRQRTYLRLKHQVRVYGCNGYLSGHRRKNSKGNYSYFILLSSHDTKQARRWYAKRWKIEQMFKDMKSSGFDIEQTGLYLIPRLDQLLSVICIAMVAVILRGRACAAQKPRLIERLKHKRRRVSIFRLGLDELQRHLDTFVRRWLTDHSYTSNILLSPT